MNTVDDAQMWMREIENELSIIKEELQARFVGEYIQGLDVGKTFDAAFSSLLTLSNELEGCRLDAERTFGNDPRY